MISPQQLEQFGLNLKESTIYLACLELGASSVQNIAKKSSQHRVSAYDILEKLIEKGFVEKIIKGKKRLFSAVKPEMILDNLKNKELMFSSLIPELVAIQSKDAHQPKVMYFEGREGVLKAHMDRIRHKPELKENLVYGSSEKLLTNFPKEYESFIKEKVAKGIKVKLIVEKSKHGLWEQKHEKEHLRDTKFLPSGVELSSSIAIYGDRVLTIAWDSMIAVIIEDKKYADNQRILFGLLWQYLPQ